MGVLGPQYYDMNDIWALKPYYLGPWTLSVTKAETTIVFTVASTTSAPNQMIYAYALALKVQGPK